MKTQPLYIFAGGGSGGHLYPGLAVANALQAMQVDARILFLCTQRQIDADILGNSGFEYKCQPVIPVPRKPFLWPDFLKRWNQSKKITRQLIEQNNVKAILGLGGFASGAALGVAAKCNISAAMLNPDAVPGKANKHCAKYVQQIFLQWPYTADYFGKYQSRCIVTGCPIRDGFARKDDTKTSIDIEPNKKLLLIVGGSLGGRTLNNAVATMFKTNHQLMSNDWQILHITGNNDYQEIVQTYKDNNLAIKVVNYVSDMDKILPHVDLAIGRAGASTVAELTACSVPAILLPYPFHKDNHQTLNAQVATDCGAMQIVTDTKDQNKTAIALAQALMEAMEPENLTQMTQASSKLAKPDAAYTIAQKLIERSNN
ncbi:MAG: UDP-N-acetylglucosamine--N-acetylmuramyl-(pentapeptide) pyrophosphoryl-undecaprenol N-acetylglucosamine transferase [Phycisphaerae bacterium]|nr:UDP-N-acetylglucosamine--N-acetylmuramyl-(pentapeptide) pyrophosphoryl-undecaprenol N-acetylglucosamine transferase [Phycisphaerae bacterium]